MTNRELIARFAEFSGIQDNSDAEMPNLYMGFGVRNEEVRRQLSSLFSAWDSVNDVAIVTPEMLLYLLLLAKRFWRTEPYPVQDLLSLVFRFSHFAGLRFDGEVITAGVEVELRDAWCDSEVRQALKDWQCLSDLSWLSPYFLAYIIMVARPFWKEQEVDDR